MHIIKPSNSANYFFSITAICLCLANNVYGESEKFKILSLSDNKTIHCNNFSVKNDIVSCLESSSRIKWQYDKKNVEIFFNDIKIYPYKWNITNIIDAIDNEKCSNIIKYLYGPYLIDNKKDTYQFIAFMHEKGVCNNVDKETALKMYELAYQSDKSNSKLSDKINELKIEKSKSDFQIFRKDNSFIECNDIDADNHAIRCNNEILIHRQNLKSIFFKKEKIYPYDNEWEENISKFLNTNDCQGIIKNIYGPALIDKKDSSYIFFAQMYENGTCVPKDKKIALGFYKQSLASNYDFASERIKSLEDEIKYEEKLEAEMNIRLKEEELKRIAEEEAIARIREAEQSKRREILNNIDSKCQMDCSVDKYRYSRGCHDACMQAHGF